MLHVHQISYAKNNQRILEQLSFRMKPGEIIGVMGESGVGKTTFGKILGNYIRPDTGYIQLTNEKKGAYPVQVLFQHPEQSVNPKWRIKRVLEEAGPIDTFLLKQFRIDEEWMERFPSQLSSGQLQRVCIVRCLLTNPSYVVADEITSMLDSISQKEIWKNLLRIAKLKNIGILVISHDRILLEKICSTIYELKEFQLKPILHSTRMPL